LDAGHRIIIATAVWFLKIHDVGDSWYYYWYA
jgi:hypothetical protein